MPDHLKIAIEERISEAQAAAGEAGFLLDGSRIDGKAAAERRREVDDEAFDNLRSRMAAKQERDRQEWAQQTHEFAGQKLTGEEWADISRELSSGGKGQQWLIDYLVSQGQTKEQAEKPPATCSSPLARISHRSRCIGALNRISSSVTKT